MKVVEFIQTGGKQMKRVFIALLILAAGAGFAAGLNDDSVTIGAWMAPSVTVTALPDDKGFALETERAKHSMVLGDQVSGWLYNPNETITVIIDENIFGSNYTTGNYYIYLAGMAGGNINSPSFSAPYYGPGTYTLTINDLPELDPGTALDTINIYFAQRSGGSFSPLTFPTAGNLTLRFKPEAEEPIVPEPTAIAYGLVGLTPLFGLKRRIKK